MKNILCLLTSLLIFSTVYAQTSVNFLDTSCFENKAVINNIDEIKAIEIMTPYSQFIAIQAWEILDQKFKESWKNLSSYLVNLKSKSTLEIYTSYKCLDDKEFNIKYKNLITEGINKEYNIWENLLSIIPFFDINPNFNKDIDKDSIINQNDNCRFVANKDQSDKNWNWIWDLCENVTNSDLWSEYDIDNDQIQDWVDNCLNVYNPDQKDSDKNWIWDLCDKTNEVVVLEIEKTIEEDKKPIEKVSLETTLTKKELGKKIEEEVKEEIKEESKEEVKKKLNNIIDTDQDWVSYFKDNCKEVKNPKQKDQDKDWIWDECDNCPSVSNLDQTDNNKNWVWDICEDLDEDWIPNWDDNCANIANKNQKDSNKNWVWDICEDLDRDWILTNEDNCPEAYNVNQLDSDKDWIWDKCDNISSINGNNEFDKQYPIWMIILITLISWMFVFWILKKIISKL